MCACNLENSFMSKKNRTQLVSYRAIGFKTGFPNSWLASIICGLATGLSWKWVINMYKYLKESDSFASEESNPRLSA